MDKSIYLYGKFEFIMTTALDLSPYSNIEHAYLIKFTFIDSSNNPETVRMSSYRVPISIQESDGNYYSYTAVGQIVNVSQIQADNKATLNDVTVTLNGIGNAYIPDIIATQIKTAPVEIRRAYFDPKTGQLLPIAGNPSIAFSGVVTNYLFDEQWTEGSNQSVTTTIALTCASLASVLTNKVAGRRTNRDDQQFWYPGDNAMNRVGVIADQYFDFGGTTPIATPVASPGTTTG